jgi:hypothetical protein
MVTTNSSRTSCDITSLIRPSITCSIIAPGAPRAEYNPEKMTLVSRKTRSLVFGSIAISRYLPSCLSPCFLQVLLADTRPLESPLNFSQRFQCEFFSRSGHERIILHTYFQHIAWHDPHLFADFQGKSDLPLWSEHHIRCLFLFQIPPPIRCLTSDIPRWTPLLSSLELTLSMFQ